MVTKDPPCPTSRLSKDSRLQNRVPCRKIPGTSLVRNGPCRLVWSSLSKTCKNKHHILERSQTRLIRNAQGGRLYERYACFQRPKRSSRVFLCLWAHRAGIWVRRHPCTSPPFVSLPVQARGCQCAVRACRREMLDTKSSLSSASDRRKFFSGAVDMPAIASENWILILI